MTSKFALGALLLFALPATSQQPAAPAASQFIAQWAAAVGGRQRVASIRTIYRTSSSDEDGLSGSRREWLTASLERKEFIDHGQDQSLTVLNGSGAWMRDWNNKLQKLVAYDLGMQVDLAVLHSFAALTGKAGGVEYLGEGLDGKADVVRFHPRRGLPLTYYLDKSTHLPLQADWPSFDGPMTTTFSDWRVINGIRIPFSETQSDGINTTKVQLQQITFNGKGTSFAPPPDGPADAFFLAPAPVTVPFNFDNRHIIFKAQVNGSAPAWFLLDTGSNFSIINQSEVATFHLKSYGGLTTEGGANTTTGAYVEGVTYRVGGVEVRNQHAAVLSLLGLEKVFGMRLGGMLGYDFISRFVMAIDYPKQTISFYPANYQYRGTGSAAAFFMQQQQPYMNESITVKDKKIPALFILDVGAADTLTLTTPFVKQNDLVEIAGESRSNARKLAGSEKEFFGGTTMRGLVDHMQFGAFTLNHIPVNLSLGTHGAYASPFFSGNIGETIFSRFDRMWLDYPRNRIILEPGAQLAAPFPEHRSFGLTLLSDGPELTIYRVTAVEAGSPAQQAGFVKGDVITAVDAVPASKLTVAKLHEILGEQGSQHEFAIERGQQQLQLQVTVQDEPISNIQ